jgi:hypothetical protein
MTTSVKNLWIKRSLLALCAFLVALAIGCMSGGGQPHMHAAMEELRAARADLEAANADKGGHRVHAIELTDAAIEQTRMGIDFARTH